MSLFQDFCPNCGKRWPKSWCHRCERRTGEPLPVHKALRVFPDAIPDESPRVRALVSLYNDLPSGAMGEVAFAAADVHIDRLGMPHTEASYVRAWLRSYDAAMREGQEAE